MGLKNKNNPLGQRIPSDEVGGPDLRLEHGQSAELVDEVRRKARQGINDNAGREPLNTPKPLQKKIPRSPDATTDSSDLL